VKVVVGVATVGRASVLCEMLGDLSLQTRRPDEVIVCAPNEGDMQGAVEAYPGCLTVIGARGLTKQRNRIIQLSQDADILVFFDDDFFATPDYLAEVEALMAAREDVAIVTGRVIADGINGPGLTVEEGRTLLAVEKSSGLTERRMSRVFTGYGCNMAIRMASLLSYGLTFDERLPLYGWQEDVDLSRRVAVHGKIVALSSASGVHLGVKHGRNSGIRLGYSQVANPLYIAAKRQGYPHVRAIEHIARNFLANMVKTLRPEPYIDRRGRLKGNVLGFIDLLRNRLEPERAEKL